MILDIILRFLSFGLMAWSILFFSRYLFLHNFINVSANHLRVFGQVVIAFALLLPIASIISSQNLSTEIVKIIEISDASYIPIVPESNNTWKLDPIEPKPEGSLIWLWLSLFTVAFVFSESKKYFHQIKLFRKMIHCSQKYKSIGRIEVLLSPGDFSPFSIFDYRKHYVVIPKRMTEDHLSFKMAVQHEIQHIRQGDTWSEHIYQFMQIFMKWNPFYVWSLQILNDFQEFSCDEFLIQERGHSPKKYGRLLVESCCVSNPEGPLVGAHHMTGRSEINILKWRIRVMLKESRMIPKRFQKCLALGSAALISTVSLASSAILMDGKVTEKEAYQIAESVRNATTVPVYVDEFVVRKLNQYLLTEEGRQFMRSSLSRMPRYSSTILRQIKQRRMPKELISIPLVESGFRNLDESVNTVRGAGMWQIIPTTGRRLGLKVDSSVDERLNLPKATRAALDYLEILHNEFGDWRLAMIAYNRGESGLRNIIARTGTRDVTELRRNGEINDYMSSTMAAILILKRPDLLK